MEKSRSMGERLLFLGNGDFMWFIRTGYCENQGKSSPHKGFMRTRFDENQGEEVLMKGL
jgi:hypothetical protein